MNSLKAEFFVPGIKRINKKLKKKILGTPLLPCRWSRPCDKEWRQILEAEQLPAVRQQRCMDFSPVVTRN